MTSLYVLCVFAVQVLFIGLHDNLVFLSRRWEDAGVKYERPLFPSRGLSVFMAENEPLGLFRYRCFFHWAIHADCSGKLHPENQIY